jgi:hypothetical protein
MTAAEKIATALRGALAIALTVSQAAAGRRPWARDADARRFDFRSLGGQ